MTEEKEGALNIYIYIYTCLIEKNGTLIVYYLFSRVLIFPN